MNSAFPYTPYPQQQELMNAIHECIKSEKIGCFESPTGTGKSMSILYASYSWLIEEEERLLKEYDKESIASENIKAQEKEDDWFADLLATKSSNNTEETTQFMANCTIATDFKNTRKRIQNQDLLKTQQNKSKYFSFSTKKDIMGTNSIELKILNTATSYSIEEEDEHQFALNPYDSADEMDSRTKSACHSHSSIDDDDDNAEIERLNLNFNIKSKPLFPKIFYCSRTHTQISQVVKCKDRYKYVMLSLTNHITYAHHRLQL